MSCYLILVDSNSNKYDNGIVSFKCLKGFGLQRVIVLIKHQICYKSGIFFLWNNL